MNVPCPLMFSTIIPSRIVLFVTAECQYQHVQNTAWIRDFIIPVVLCNFTDGSQFRSQNILPVPHQQISSTKEKENVPNCLLVLDPLMGHWFYSYLGVGRYLSHLLIFCLVEDDPQKTPSLLLRRPASPCRLAHINNHHPHQSSSTVSCSLINKSIPCLM